MIDWLNNEHENHLMDFVEVWADQRNMVKYQRLHSAKALEIRENDLKIQCTYHLWETEERTDVFFQHKATDDVIVSINMISDASTYNDAMNTLNEMISFVKNRAVPIFE